MATAEAQQTRRRIAPRAALSQAAVNERIFGNGLSRVLARFEDALYAHASAVDPQHPIVAVHGATLTFPTPAKRMQEVAASLDQLRAEFHQESDTDAVIRQYHPLTELRAEQAKLLHAIESVDEPDYKLELPVRDSDAMLYRTIDMKPLKELAVMQAKTFGLGTPGPARDWRSVRVAFSVSLVPRTAGDDDPLKASGHVYNATASFPACFPSFYADLSLVPLAKLAAATTVQELLQATHRSAPYRDLLETFRGPSSGAATVRPPRAARLRKYGRTSG